MDRWKCPKPETIREAEWLAFSYNPKDQPMLNPTNRVDPFTDHLKTWHTEEIAFFNRLKYCEIECRLEVSSQGRLHVHGRIAVKDIVRFFTVDIRRLQARGTYEIDTIQDPVKWDQYCRKQSENMSEFCTQEGIPYVFKNYVDIVI